MTNAGTLSVQVKGELARFKSDMASMKKQLGSVDRSMKKSAKSTKVFNNALGSLKTLFITGAIAAGFKSIVRTSIQYENALLGISAVARAVGISEDEATKASKSLASDGLMSVAEAAEGLKNLLATGFNLEESINLMNSFRDAAAFNRQGTLGFGEAIVGATQGIKNQNSIMVDNVGITKNLSLIMKEAGFTLQDLSDTSKKAAAQQVLYNGLLNEAVIFSGNAEEASTTLGGKLSSLEVSWADLQVEMGKTFEGPMKDVLDWLITVVEKLDPVIEKFTELAGVFKRVMGGETTPFGELMGALFPSNTPEQRERDRVKEPEGIIQEFQASSLGNSTPLSFDEAIRREASGLGKISRNTQGDFTPYTSAAGKEYVNFQPTVNVTVQTLPGENLEQAAKRLGVVILDEIKTLSEGES